MRKSTLHKLQSLQNELELAPRRPLNPELGWNDDLPRMGGVYVIWDRESRKKPIYVGETCDLKRRFGDLRRNVNHSFRRTIAKRLKLRRLSDKKVSKKLSEKYDISFVVIDFGRKELEEFLVFCWGDRLINKPPKRLRMSRQYANI